jgi:DNA polymerase-3 subunit gamma/tau
VVRLLTVLSEAEGQIRSSGHARLAVEVLLLRWAMMDRTVELGEVIQALGGGSGKGETGKGAGEAPPVLRDARPTPRPPDRPTAAIAVPEAGPLTFDRLYALWPRVIADARAASPLLGALLATTEVAAVDGTTLTIRPLEDNAVHTEGIERQREALTRLLGRYVTGPVRVAFGAPGAAPRARAPRLTEDGARADRLTRLRANDPGLSAAVDALDLELLE